MNSGPQGWYKIGKAKSLYLIFSMGKKTQQLLIPNKIITKMLMPSLFFFLKEKKKKKKTADYMPLEKTLDILKGK